MKFLPLLGKKLKDDAVIEVLEDFEMEVIYDFDRLHEGQPDKYWAASKTDGWQFRFDAMQQLEVVFLYLMPGEGFAAISRQDCDLPLFTSLSAAEAFGETHQLPITQGKTDFLGVNQSWIKHEFATYSIHYEFHADSLARITISRKDGSKPHALG